MPPPWNQSISGDTDNNFLYLMEVSVGTPPQKALFMIDIHTIYNYVFTTGGNYSS
jgi:hypothetical protein